MNVMIQVDRKVSLPTPGRERLLPLSLGAGTRRRPPVSLNSRKHLGVRLAMSSMQQRTMIRIANRGAHRHAHATGLSKPLPFINNSQKPLWIICESDS
jgi:hypothetical protein